MGKPKHNPPEEKRIRNLSWSDEENGVLRNLWGNPEVSTEDLVRVFKVRSRTSVMKHADELHLEPRGSLLKDRIDHEYLKKLMTVTEG